MGWGGKGKKGKYTGYQPWSSWNSWGNYGSGKGKGGYGDHQLRQSVQDLTNHLWAEHEKKEWAEHEKKEKEQWDAYTKSQEEKDAKMAAERAEERKQNELTAQKQLDATNRLIELQGENRKRQAAAEPRLEYKSFEERPREDVRAMRTYETPMMDRPSYSPRMEHSGFSYGAVSPRAEMFGAGSPRAHPYESRMGPFGAMAPPVYGGGHSMDFGSAAADDRYELERRAKEAEAHAAAMQEREMRARAEMKHARQREAEANREMAKARAAAAEAQRKMRGGAAPGSGAARTAGAAVVDPSRGTLALVLDLEDAEYQQLDHRPGAV